tara:strand:+ start:16430 stop:17377 length:948 start_codon:yes stop_codon:yes gene_type:complete
MSATPDVHTQEDAPETQPLIPMDYYYKIVGPSNRPTYDVFCKELSDVTVHNGKISYLSKKNHIVTCDRSAEFIKLLRELRKIKASRTDPVAGYDHTSSDERDQVNLCINALRAEGKASVRLWNNEGSCVGKVTEFEERYVVHYYTDSVIATHKTIKDAVIGGFHVTVNTKNKQTVFVQTGKMGILMDNYTQEEKDMQSVAETCVPTEYTTCMISSYDDMGNSTVYSVVDGCIVNQMYLASPVYMQPTDYPMYVPETPIPTPQPSMYVDTGSYPSVPETPYYLPNLTQDISYAKNVGFSMNPDTPMYAPVYNQPMY